MKKLKDFLKRINEFITKDVWTIHLDQLPKNKSFFIKQLRFFILTIKGFIDDKCVLRASSLTYFTMLSIVPVVAMVFGIAKGFGYEKNLEQQLKGEFTAHEEIFNQVFLIANQVLENTKGGLIAGIGFALLFWSVMKVLGNIESSFNDIWEIKRSRTFLRKLSDYITIMLIAPIIITVSSSITVFINAYIIKMTNDVEFLEYFSPFIFSLLKLIPYCLIWLVFTFIYMAMPNTKVNFKSALIAGIFAGTIFQVVQWGYIHFQVGVTRYNAIYGSFAALPLFLIWMQISWIIVLLGAEISFAHQNINRYEFEIGALNISSNYKRLLSLSIVHLIIKRFSKAERPFTAVEISKVLEIPIRIVRQIVYELVECNIFSEAKSNNEKDLAYQPAYDISNLSIRDVIEALDNRGARDVTIAQTNELQVLSETLDSFRNEIGKSSSNILLKDI